MVYSQVNDLQFSHWVEDVLAVVENLTDGPVVLVKAQRWTHGLGKTRFHGPGKMDLQCW